MSELEPLRSCWAHLETHQVTTAQPETEFKSQKCLTTLNWKNIQKSKLRGAAQAALLQSSYLDFTCLYSNVQCLFKNGTVEFQVRK